MRGARTRVVSSRRSHEVGGEFVVGWTNDESASQGWCWSLAAERMRTAGDRMRRGRDTRSASKGALRFPGLAPRVVRHVERDSGRFVVWHVVDGSPGCAQL